MTRHRIRFALLLALLLLAVTLVVTACGSKSSSSSSASSGTTTQAAGSGGSGGGGTTLKLSADPSGAFKFDKTSLTAPAGVVTIVMTNPSSTPHGVAVNGNGVDQTGSIVSSGGQSKVTMTLKAGTYTFFCPVPGHEQAGMKGTLTIT